MSFGLTYRTQSKMKLRGTMEFDAPAPAETMNVLIPSFSFNSFTAGFGYRKGGFKVDVGLEYLIGQKRTVTAGMMPGVYEMRIWVPMFALSYGW